jgi:hypothetical protein
VLMGRAFGGSGWQMLISTASSQSSLLQSTCHMQIMRGDQSKGKKRACFYVIDTRRGVVYRGHAGKDWQMKWQMEKEEKKDCGLRASCASLRGASGLGSGSLGPRALNIKTKSKPIAAPAHNHNP